MISGSLVIPSSQFDHLGEAYAYLSALKFAEFGTLEPVTRERYIRFWKTWLENVPLDFLFKIEHHYQFSKGLNNQNKNDKPQK